MKRIVSSQEGGLGGPFQVSKSRDSIGFNYCAANAWWIAPSRFCPLESKGSGHRIPHPTTILRDGVNLVGLPSRYVVM